MAERYLGDLLEEVDKVPHSRRSTISKAQGTVGDLIIEKDIPEDLILEAFERDLIRDANDPQHSKTFDRNIDKSIRCILTITGFQYLNQIRIKRAIEDLNNSIDSFKKSSDRAYSQLDGSIIKFNESSDKYSKKLIDLTFAIYAFTVLVVILTTYPLTKDFVLEKTLPLIPFLNSSASASVYAGIFDIGIIVVIFWFFRKVVKDKFF